MQTAQYQMIRLDKAKNCGCTKSHKYHFNLKIDWDSELIQFQFIEAIAEVSMTVSLAEQPRGRYWGTLLLSASHAWDWRLWRTGVKRKDDLAEERKSGISLGCNIINHFFEAPTYIPRHQHQWPPHQGTW